ncbi:MAG: hypothetical protein AAGF02_15650 [Actinomycetota bacterium]
MSVRRLPLPTGAVMVVLVAAGACTSGQGADPADHCDVVAQAVDAGALADDLISPAGGPLATRERIGEVLGLLDPVAASAPDDQATDWRLLRDGIVAADVALEGYGYDLVSIATSESDDADPLVALSGDATTELRIRLADDVGERCGVTVMTPTGALGLPRSTEVEVDDLDPRVVDPLELPPERLAGLLARTFDAAELDAAFAAADVDSVSELADRPPAPDAAEAAALLAELVDRVQVRERGDDERLDVLWDDCEGGDDSSCDLLAFLAPPGSAYEVIGATCGGRSEAQGAGACSERELR